MHCLPIRDIYVTRDEYGAIFIIFTIKEMRKKYYDDAKENAELREEHQFFSSRIQKKVGRYVPFPLFCISLSAANGGRTIFSWQEQRPQGSEKPRRKACSPDQQKRAGRGFWGPQRAYLNVPQKTVFTSVL